MTSVSLLGWTLLRPIALAAVLLPVAIVLLSFRRQRPRTVLLGTTRFFEEGEAAASARRRRRLSGARWAAIVALLLGTLAAAAPRPEPGVVPPEVFVLHVDRSPSMYLPVDPSDPGGRRRIDAALAAARDWLRERDDALVRWADAGAATPTDAPAVSVSAPAPDWVGQRPAIPAPDPVWGALDRPGNLLVTDTVPDPEPRSAGLFASGGAKVAGPAAIGAEGLLVWTGDDDAPLTIGDAGRRPTVRIDGDTADGVDALVRLWADERAVDVVESGVRPDLLVRAGARSGKAAELLAGRDGWSARFDVRGGQERASNRDPGGELEPWLVAKGGRTLVAVRPGTIELFFSGMTAEPTDPAAFAVSWAALLDGALLPPPDVISIDERRAAGAPVVLEPDLTDLRGTAADVDAALRAEKGRRAELALAAAAALAGLLALVLRVGGSS